MSEELKKGIPKAKVTGENEVTPAKQKKYDKDFEKILKEYGILKESQSIKNLKK